MTERLRILFFSPKACVPADTGARLRNFHLSRQLSRHADVTFLAFAETEQTAEANAAAVTDWGPQKVVLVPRQQGYTAAKLAQGLVGKTPLTVLNYTTRRMAQTLKQLLYEQDFDVVQVESLLLSEYLPILRAARHRPALVCDWHNIDSEVMRRYSNYNRSLPHRFYARLTARQLERLEKASLRRFDAHLTVSERDRQTLLKLDDKASVIVADNGVDTEYFSGVAEAAAPRCEAGRVAAKPKKILFVGSMDYHANIDAVTRFANDVWLDIHQACPGLTFSIVGRNPALAVRKLAQLPGVEVTGTVADVRPFYAEAIAAVVPLRIGGGSRLKILEALAAGVPVISTRLGAEGIALTDKENFLLAESKQDFLQALLAVATNQALRANLVASGLSFVRRNYRWEAIAETILRTFSTLVAIPAPASLRSPFGIPTGAEVKA